MSIKTRIASTQEKRHRVVGDIVLGMDGILKMRVGAGFRWGERISVRGRTRANNQILASIINCYFLNDKSNRFLMFYKL